MSPSKSFWSGIPVVAKTLGGIATGIVGVGGLLVALGVIGGSNNSSPTATTLPSSSNTPGATGNSGGSGGVTTTSARQGSFTLDRTDVTLGGLLSPKATVTVTNKGSVPLSLTRPEVLGTDKDRFGVVATECTGSDLEPGKSCSIEVTFSGAAQASATMVVSADNASASTQVKLKGNLA